MLRIIQDTDNEYLIKCVTKAFELLPLVYRNELQTANQEIRICNTSEVQGLNKSSKTFYALAAYTAWSGTAVGANTTSPTIIFDSAITKSFSEERIIEVAVKNLVYLAQLVSNRVEDVLVDGVFTRHWRGYPYLECKAYVDEEMLDAKYEEMLDAKYLPWNIEALNVVVVKVKLLEKLKLKLEYLKALYEQYFPTNGRIKPTRYILVCKSQPLSPEI